MDHTPTKVGPRPLEGLIVQYQVRYAVLPARDIFGMVGRCGGGYNSIWTDWSDRGRKLRELIMKEYEEGLDRICGHYSRLEASIRVEGIRNPVIITCGLPRRRTMENLPPELRSRPPSDLLLLETTMGGSRLHVCQKLGLDIPCIINDWTGRFSSSPEICNEQDARLCYMDQPSSITFHPQMGIQESFDTRKVGHHLGEEWSEDRLMPLRAPLWIGIMNKYGYRVDRLPKIVEDVLKRAGVDQSRI